MTGKTLRRKVKETVRKHDPTAQITLFGSRARGDAASDSDWDFLILLAEPADAHVKKAIRHALYEIEWDSGQVISCVIHSRDEWHSAPLTSTPFHSSIDREGVTL